MKPKMIETFYEKGTRDVRPKLFDTIANKIATEFIGRNKENQFGKVTKRQLRRLFDEVKRFEQVLDGTPENWKKNYPLIRMVKSKASYNIARSKTTKGNNDVWDNLYGFIDEGIGLIEVEEDYHVFLSLFEAVYGFYYVLNPAND